LQQVLETRRDALYWRHDGSAKRDILFHDHPSRIVVFLEHAKKRGKINRSLANDGEGIGGDGLRKVHVTAANLRHHLVMREPLAST
jgi:hypothetical protein